MAQKETIRSPLSAPPQSPKTGGHFLSPEPAGQAWLSLQPTPHAASPHFVGHGTEVALRLFSQPVAEQMESTSGP